MYYSLESKQKYITLNIEIGTAAHAYLEWENIQQCTHFQKMSNATSFIKSKK